MKRYLPILALLLLVACGKQEPAPQPDAPADEYGLNVPRVAQAGPALGPDATVFEQGAELEITLLPQLIVAPYNKEVSVSSVKVRAVHDGQWLSLRMAWSDASRDDKPGIGDFEDMLAVQIPRVPGTMPNPMMGDANGEVVIFQWRAGVQAALDRGERPDVKHAYPYTHKDLDIADLLGHEAGAPYRGAAGLGNPLALGDLEISPVFVMVAAGFSTLTTWPTRYAEARGVHDGNGWALAMHIPLSGEASAALKAGGESLISFAAWDGNYRETGSRKAWAPAWTPIRLAP